MRSPLRPPPSDALAAITRRTLAHYEAAASSFREGTLGHDVTQNYDALLRHVEGAAPLALLDLGCGPGRDLAWFRDHGHAPVGLDGALEFVEMARAHSGCEVLHQDFLALDLPPDQFDGVFANASLFHVPKSELPRVLAELRATLRPRGVLFSSNPRGDNREGWSGDRYGCFHDLEQWRELVVAAGFSDSSTTIDPLGCHETSNPGSRRCGGRRTQCQSDNDPARTCLVRVQNGEPLPRGGPDSSLAALAMELLE